MVYSVYATGSGVWPKIDWCLCARLRVWLSVLVDLTLVKWAHEMRVHYPVQEITLHFPYRPNLLHIDGQRPESTRIQHLVFVFGPYRAIFGERGGVPKIVSIQPKCANLSFSGAKRSNPPVSSEKPSGRCERSEATAS